MKEYVKKNFPSHSLLDYALAVEKVTTSKKDTLILNVDGCIAVCFVDLLRDSGAFTPEEADEYIKVSFIGPIAVFPMTDGECYLRLVLSTVSSSLGAASVSSVTTLTRSACVHRCTVTQPTISSSTWRMSRNPVSPSSCRKDLSLFHHVFARCLLLFGVLVFSYCASRV